MSIALYPYSQYNFFVGDYPRTIVENEIRQADFCAVTLTTTGASGLVSVEGTLSYHITFYDVCGKKIKRNICLSPLSSSQSDTYVHDNAVHFITCYVTSTT